MVYKKKGEEIMEAIDCIRSRRSIRKFHKDPVSEEMLQKITGAAMLAPSARNTQSWQFVVCDDREKLDKIPDFHPYSAMVRQAPLAILVCGDTELEANESYLLQNCSAAVQNILLASHSLGLGSVWLGVHPREPRIEGMRKLFSIPESVIPVALLVIGHPAEEKDIPLNRIKSDRIHTNRW